jgi:DNA-binding NarL/FixJ family response regulator
MSDYRIVLADDHAMFRRGMKKILQDEDAIEVVGEAGDGLELLEVLKHVKPDMVILDLSMPNLRGLEATREIKATYPHIKVLVLTMHRDKEYVRYAISAGAEGYLLKEEADTELFAAIKKIRSGECYISPILSGELTHQLIRDGNEQCSDRSSSSLTLREREILKLIAEGKSHKEIAELLFISARTVDHHRSNLMKKLNIKDTANLTKYAIREGLTSITH